MPISFFGWSIRLSKTRGLAFNTVRQAAHFARGSFYYHFLARNWQEYSTIPLADFARHAYCVIQRFDAFLPPRAKQTLPRMMANNWLVNYGKLEGIDRAMQGMAGRASFPSSMAGAIGDLQKDYVDFERDFRSFFPELVTHSQTCLQALV